jgi:hypothetical protein
MFASRADNRSKVVSEFARAFMKYFASPEAVSDDFTYDRMTFRI